MEQDSSEEAMTEFKERTLGGWGLLQITAGTGLAVYTVWAGIIMPGFRRVPLKLQLPLLQEKLLSELPLDALVVAGRFPFPGWAPCRTEGVGVHRAWAYNIQALRQAARNQDQGTPV